jgi:competence protein ComEC
MVNRPQFSPVLSAACGAAIGFYCLSVLFRAGIAGIYGIFACLAVPAAALCLIRALGSFPVFFAEQESAGGERASRNSTPGRLRLAGRYTAAFAAGLALGLGAGGAAPAALSFGLPDNAVRAVSGVLLEDPRLVAGGRAMAALALRECSGAAGSMAAGSVRVSARGELTVFFPGESASRLREFGRGSTVFAEGSLRASSGPRTAARETAESWLFSAQSVHVVTPAPALERFRTGLRLNLVRRFVPASVGGAASAGSAASWGGLALALLLGIRDNLDSGLAELYRNAGCSYVLALSGMHLAVLAGIISLLLKKPLGLKSATITGALLIILYCFIVGPLPSLTRAALMYLLGALAVLGALKPEGLSLLCMAFLIQIGISPQSGYSISFILSYLALLGILSAGEALNSLFRGTIPACLLRPLSASLGAFLATAAVTAYFFGVLRPVGIVTGLVLVPLTTVFMIGGMIWLALNLISPVLSGFLSVPLSLLYGLMEKTVSLAGRVPGLAAIPPPPLIALSLGLWLFLVYFARRRRLARTRAAPFA